MIFQIGLRGQLHNSVRGEALFSKVFQIPGELYLAEPLNQAEPLNLWLGLEEAWEMSQVYDREKGVTSLATGVVSHGPQTSVSLGSHYIQNNLN